MFRWKPDIQRWLRLVVAEWLTASSLLMSVPVPDAHAASSATVTLTVSLRDSFPPKPVADLDAASSATEGEVLLAWTAPSEDTFVPPSVTAVAQYTVKLATYSVQSVASTVTWWTQATDINNEPFPPKLPGETEVLTLSNLEPGTTFWFAVKSQDEVPNLSPIDDNASSPVLQAKVVVPDLAPPAPANLIPIPTDARIDLTWDAVSANDLDFYRVHVDSVAPYDFSDGYAIVVDSVSTNYSHSGLTNANTYYYYVTAVDKGAPSFSGEALESATSNIDYGVPGVGLPAAPTLSVDLTQTTTRQIRWVLKDNANNEAGLYIFLAPNTNVSPNLGPLPSTGNTTSYIETGLSPNRPYTRYGKASNGDGNSFSDPLTAYTLANPPADTQVVGVTTDTIDLSWSANDNPGGTRFEVEYSSNASFNIINQAGSAVGTSFTIPNLKPNSHYWIRVRSVNGDNRVTGYDVTVSTKTAKLQDTVPPKSPVGVWAEWLAQPSEGSVKLHWRGVTENIDGTSFTDPAPEPYKIYRSETLNIDPQSTAPKVIDVNPAFSAQSDSFGPAAADTMESDQTYYYRVRAVDLAGNESPDSMIVEAKGDGTVLNMLSLGEDNRSGLIIPASAARSLLLKEYNGQGDDLIIKTIEVPGEEEGRVMRSVM
ncbi:MAG: fibronectin type III domain-containing protein, partial [Elusimicrobia bacterium]|nr:fibronectin type III domain-containing protein [Elusimicrobiota bacterium]